MLKSFRVKLLVLTAIPDLVETWVTGFGFKPIEENEKKLLNNITLMLFPGASMLTKSLLDNESEKSGLCFCIILSFRTKIYFHHKFCSQNAPLLIYVFSFVCV